jgi:hypothetical protein
MNVLLAGVKSDSPFILKFAAGSLAGTYLHTHVHIRLCMRFDYLILSYPILSYPILSYPILSYPILSYPILSYHILPYSIL